MSDTPDIGPDTGPGAGPLDSLRSMPVGHGLLLGLLSLGAAVILAATFDATRGVIALRQSEDLLASLAQVLPDALHANDPSATLRALTDAEEGEVQVYLAAQGNNVTGTAFEPTTNPIELKSR